jgi:phage portal protein BeeE
MLIMNVLATVPLHLYKRVGEGRERDRGHPLDRLVSAPPNAEHSSFTYRRLMM